MVRKGWADGDGPRFVWAWRLDRRRGNFLLGVYLVALGVFLLLLQQGIIDRYFWREGWPWILIVIGSATLLAARTASTVGNGVFTGLLGVWFLIVTTEWRGLTWRNGWPLVLVVIGASIVTQGLAGLFLPEQQPKHRASGSERGKEGDRDA